MENFNFKNHSKCFYNSHTSQGPKTPVLHTVVFKGIIHLTPQTLKSDVGFYSVFLHEQLRSFIK
jgi:hypothetical protein